MSSGSCLLDDLFRKQMKRQRPWVKARISTAGIMCVSESAEGGREKIFCNEQVAPCGLTRCFIERFQKLMTRVQKDREASGGNMQIFFHLEKRALLEQENQEFKIPQNKKERQLKEKQKTETRTESWA